jgi:hypothetical protein
MDKEASRGDENERGRSAKKENTAGTTADDAVVSSQPPSRIHIFKGKPLPDVSSKSDGEQTQRSSFQVELEAILQRLQRAHYGVFKRRK